MTPRPHDRRQLDLLARAVNSARRTKFWRLRLGDSPINSMDDFASLPIVQASEYRRQRFADLIDQPDEISWIPGPWLGQSAGRAPVAEGSGEARNRVRILRQRLARAVPDGIPNPTAVVVSTFDNRYFAAEMCAVFVRMGVPAHLVSDSGTDRLAELVSEFEPDIVALLSAKLDVSRLPCSVRHIVTVRATQMPERIPCLDLYVCNEFGALGMRTDSGDYRLAHDDFHFETSPNGTLVVTPYFSRVQPIVRLDTGDRIRVTPPSNLC